MRLALISDLHANELALEATLADIERAGVDQIACLGDVATLGPSPRAVLQRVRKLGGPCILGNHDAFLLDPEAVHEYTEAPDVVAAVDWCHGQLTQEDLDFVRSFQPMQEIRVDARSSILLYHGTPRSHSEDLLATTPDRELDEMLDGREATVLAGGHTHLQMLRRHRGMTIVNPGSVGLPFRDYVFGARPTLLPDAEYAIVDVRRGFVDVSLRRVALDRESLRAAADASDEPIRNLLVAHYQ